MSLLCSLALAGATVYRWVDENGVVHYSDQPHANAEKLHVNAAQSYKPAALESSPAGGGGQAATASAAPYRGCAIVQPQDDQTFANIDSLTVVVQTDPQLHSGDRVYVTVDGQALNAGNPTGAQFVLSPVERGTHTAQAQVKDSGGAVQCQTPPVTFHVQQNSVLNPNNNRVTPH
ncbi:MAG TPA: DUF4124 domain-containing protein [Steroidobacteraceae bacterium]|jgi:hypothetical protein|nr:DUF4124 domain-containing protein [Steroidobacteraceae bacterium]